MIIYQGNYLPIHPAMKPFLKEGMRVVHNGGSGRQGMAGVIHSLDRPTGDVRVLFDSHNSSCKFKVEFFLSSFYIELTSVRKCYGFKHDSYIQKYTDFIAPVALLKRKQLNTHEEMKCIVDAKLKGYTSLYENKQDPLDEVGTFMVIDSDGKWLGTHKTQRLAEIYASEKVKKENKRLRIVKHCADVDPRVIIEADIIRK